MKTIFIIPARLNSSRLPRKILYNINGKTLLEYVIDNLRCSNIHDFLVACDSEEVAELCSSIGVRAVLTDPDLPSGTDRVSAAAKTLPDEYDTIVNIQGDLAVFDVSRVFGAIDLLASSKYDMTTIAIPLVEERMIYSPTTVKVAIAKKSESHGDALYFSRSAIPYNSSEYYQHLGVYVFKKSVIEKFSSLPQSPLEKTEKLEQLRALENGLSVGVQIVQTFDACEINCLEDVELLQKYLSKHAIKF